VAFTALRSQNGPAVLSGGAANSMGNEFYLTSQGYVTQIAYWRATTAQAAGVTCALFTVDTATTGTLVAGTSGTMPAVGTGWQLYTFSAAVFVEPLQRFRAIVQYPAGGYPEIANYWSSGPGAADIVSGPLVMPSAANATGGLQSSYASNAGATPIFTTNVFSASNWWIDVTVVNDPWVPPAPNLNQAVTRAANY
jgi:hypothetical protein